MTDPIADLLIRIKNGYLARRGSVMVPYSRFKEALLVLLQKHGYIAEFSKDETSREINVKLLYREEIPALTDVKRISKPGLRRYVGKRDLDLIKSRLGHTIISTPTGLKTHIEAKQAGTGGEVICRIW